MPEPKSYDFCRLITLKGNTPNNPLALFYYIFKVGYNFIILIGSHLSVSPRRKTGCEALAAKGPKCDDGELIDRCGMG